MLFFFQSEMQYDFETSNGGKLNINFNSYLKIKGCYLLEKKFHTGKAYKRFGILKYNVNLKISLISS